MWKKRIVDVSLEFFIQFEFIRLHSSSLDCSNISCAIHIDVRSCERNGDWWRWIVCENFFWDWKLTIKSITAGYNEEEWIPSNENKKRFSMMISKWFTDLRLPLPFIQFRSEYNEDRRSHRAQIEPKTSRHHVLLASNSTSSTSSMTGGVSGRSSRVDIIIVCERIRKLSKFHSSNHSKLSARCLMIEIIWHNRARLSEKNHQAEKSMSKSRYNLNDDDGVV